jgi:hypothetical protein
MLLRCNCVFAGAEVLHVHMTLLEKCIILLLIICCCRRCMCCFWEGVHDAVANQWLLQALPDAVTTSDFAGTAQTVAGVVHDAVANHLLLQELHVLLLEECMVLLLTNCCCRRCT